MAECINPKFQWYSITLHKTAHSLSGVPMRYFIWLILVWCFRGGNTGFITLPLQRVQDFRTSDHIFSLINDEIFILNILGCMDCNPYVQSPDVRVIASRRHMPFFTFVVVIYQKVCMLPINPNNDVFPILLLLSLIHK